MTRRIGLIGVPSSVGAHWPGQEKAPAALRVAGLVERLEAAGCAVVDHGDLARRRFRPDPGRHPQSLDAVLGVAREVAERVEAAVRAGETALVVGGTARSSWGRSRGCCGPGSTRRCSTSTAGLTCGPRPTTRPASSTRWGWRT